MKHPACPRCSQPLTEAQVKTIWASYTGKKQTPHAGPGRPRKTKKPTGLAVPPTQEQ